jgi:hypothetical protein
MPALSRLYVRTAFVYLAVGTLLGGIILWGKAVPSTGRFWQFLAAHVALVTWGWLLQLSLGMAYWILPRFGLIRPRPWLAVVTYLLLNVALLLAALAPWLGSGWTSAAAGWLQFLAVVAFATHAWPRARRSAYGK